MKLKLKRLFLKSAKNHFIILYVHFLETLTELNKLKHKFGGMPQDRALQAAAKALIRLRSTYKFDLNQFSQGNIHGLQTAAHLSTKDSFFLGKYAFSNGHFSEAKKWLEFAALQVASESQTSNQTKSNIVTTDQVDQLIERIPQETLNEDEETEEDNNPSNYKIGIIPPKVPFIN